MITIEVFVAAFSSLAVIVAGAFFWIMTDIRSLRKEMREEFRAERQERREERESDKLERREERESDKLERREERESDKLERREERESDKLERREERESDKLERREDNRALREELLTAIRTESEARRADTQRILEAIYFHRHDPDGTVALRPPAQQAAD